VQGLIDLSLPVNIPTFIQVIGRTVRKNSHINLPPEQRRVSIYVLLTMANRKICNDEISPEMYRYIEKISDYIIIQNIEREILRNAVDADLNRDIIMPKELREQYFPGGNGPVNMLGNLYFEPAHKISVSTPVITTFTSGRYFEEEIRTINFIIKRLFMKCSVWTYEQLWDAVRSPPFGLEVNPKLFSEDNFIIALDNLVAKTANIISRGPASQQMLLEKIFDQNDKYVYINGQKSQVEKIGKYYIAFPMIAASDDILNEVRDDRTVVRDRERAMIKLGPSVREHPLVDVETYVRHHVPDRSVTINIESYIADNRANAVYNRRKEQFINDSEPLMMQFMLQPDSFQIAFVEEAIVHMMTRQDETGQLVELYSKILELMSKFRVTITAGEVSRYKDTAKQYKNGMPDVAPDTIVGYSSTRFVRLYDPSVSKWFEVSKIALNRQVRYKENEVIIGYFETVDGVSKFKLRSPIHKIDVKKITKGSVTTTDIRLIERGIVCTTKSKEELLSIISKLGISASKFDSNELRVKRLCDRIMQHLVDRELRERVKDTKYKFVYSWWDEMPDLTKINTTSQ
jgi:hypothetical protein